MNQKLKAIVLLSGGLDSTTMLAMVQEQGFVPTVITFDYGQRHRLEIERAKETVKVMRVEDHRIVKLDPQVFEKSALTREIDVPTSRSVDEMNASIPVTYVPARNTIFLSYAVGFAEVVGATDIYIGVNALDYAGYPDCRPEFIEAYEVMANLATKAGVEGRKLKIHAPLIQMTKTQIVAEGLRLRVDFSKTNTCYNPSSFGEPCDKCDACILRLDGFKQNNEKDPLSPKA